MKLKHIINRKEDSNRTLQEPQSSSRQLRHVLSKVMVGSARHPRRKRILINKQLQRHSVKLETWRVVACIGVTVFEPLWVVQMPKQYLTSH